MFTAKDFPWYQELKASREDLDCFANLRRMKDKGELDNFEKVKLIQSREKYITLPQYFHILEDWDFYEEEFEKFYERDFKKAEWLKNRLSKCSFWAVRVARFITQNNLSEDPEKDLFCCLRDQDVLQYIEFVYAKDIFGSVFELESPIKSKDLKFLDPKFRVTKENTEELFPGMEEYRDVYYESVIARRLKDTLTLLLSPGVTKADKIAILNYLVNKESSGSNNVFLNTKYPKEITQRVWKSLLEQKCLLLLPKEIILKIYNNYKKVQPLNNGLGGIIKSVSGSRVRLPSEKYSKYPRLTKAEQERINTWIKILNKQRLQP